jgi:peptidoglycan glycosyltransferase
MHMAMVASAVANGGGAMRPYLVQSLSDANGTVVSSVDPKRWHAAIDQQTADTMQGLMVDAVEWGYAGAALLPGYRVGGKTGTAESGNDVPHGWFIGFAGEDEPRAVVAVLLEHGGEGGGYPAQIGAQLLSSALVNIRE